MSGTMSRADLVADLKASLHDAAGIFTAANDADYDRLFAVASQDMGRVRPLVKAATLTLVAGTAAYTAPADMIVFGRETWSLGRMPQPWEATYCGPLPQQSVVGAPGARQIVFTPAPTDMQIAVLGAAFGYHYLAAHTIDATAANTTVAAADRGLLILRAQAEAVREMALRNVNKPITLRDGISATPRNGTPSYLYDALMREFKAAV